MFLSLADHCCSCSQLVHEHEQTISYVHKQNSKPLIKSEQHFALPNSITVSEHSFDHSTYRDLRVNSFIPNTQQNSER